MGGLLRETSLLDFTPLPLLYAETGLSETTYAYDELRVYVSGIADPWVFGPDDEFDFDGDQVFVVRVGPTHEHDNAEVPEYVFPIRQVVATELSVRGG
jgi:hypothetical protein